MATGLIEAATADIGTCPTDSRTSTDTSRRASGDLRRRGGTATIRFLGTTAAALERNVTDSWGSGVPRAAGSARPRLADGDGGLD